MMNKAHRDVCPHCGSENLKIRKQGDQQLVYCYDCDKIFERLRNTTYVPRRLADLAKPSRESEPDDTPDGEQYPE